MPLISYPNSQLSALANNLANLENFSPNWPSLPLLQHLSQPLSFSQQSEFTNAYLPHAPARFDPKKSLDVALTPPADSISPKPVQNDTATKHEQVEAANNLMTLSQEMTEELNQVRSAKHEKSTTVANDNPAQQKPASGAAQTKPASTTSACSNSSLESLLEQGAPDIGKPFLRQDFEMGEKSAEEGSDSDSEKDEHADMAEQERKRKRYKRKPAKTEKEKLRRKRERNKILARESRQRKKVKYEKLEAENLNLRTENEDLRTQNLELREELGAAQAQVEASMQPSEGIETRTTEIETQLEASRRLNVALETRVAELEALLESKKSTERASLAFV